MKVATQRFMWPEHMLQRSSNSRIQSCFIPFFLSYTLLTVKCVDSKTFGKRGWGGSKKICIYILTPRKGLCSFISFWMLRRRKFSGVSLKWAPMTGGCHIEELCTSDELVGEKNKTYSITSTYWLFLVDSEGTTLCYFKQIMPIILHKLL